MLLVKAKNQEDNPAGTGWIMAGIALWSFKKIYTYHAVPVVFPLYFISLTFKSFKSYNLEILIFP